jgi:hypothetical protein
MYPHIPFAFDTGQDTAYSTGKAFFHCVNPTSNSIFSSRSPHFLLLFSLIHVVVPEKMQRGVNDQIGEFPAPRLVVLLRLRKDTFDGENDVTQGEAPRFPADFYVEAAKAPACSSCIGTTIHRSEHQCPCISS